MTKKMLLLSGSYILCQKHHNVWFQEQYDKHHHEPHFLFMFLLFVCFFKYRLISEENHELLRFESCFPSK